MPNSRLIKNNFSGGEISRELYGRIDLAKVQSGLDTCRNFIVMPQGQVSNRPGFQFVNAVKNSANFTRLIQFSFSSTQTFCIEMGAGYFRFHTLAATLNSGTPTAYSGVTAYVQGSLVSYLGRNYYCKTASTGNIPTNTAFWYVLAATGEYEIPNSYSQNDLSLIKYVQSGDVITLVHPSYPPQELKRLGNLNWTLTNIAFASQTIAPTGVAAVATYPTAGTNKTFNYKVTALNSLGYEESPASTVSNTVTNDLTIQGNFNTINWNTVTGAIRYNIYKYASGNYGYIGQTTALTMVDDNILADMTKTIPIIDATFASTNNYPATVCYFEQRRFFASTNNQPQNIWATQSASDYNMSYTIPSQSADALRFKIAAQRANSIKHVIPALDLIVLTASTEWRIFAGSGSALTASTLSIKAQAQNGVSDVMPITVGNYILYPQAQGGHIREMSYQWQSSGYMSNDLCLLAPHLFDYTTLTDMTFSRSPIPILWVINSTGQLFGLSYIPEQQVSAWHKHDTTNGSFESLVSVTENNSDVLYTIVNRTIGGVTKRYIECLHSRKFDTPADAFFVDCALTYSGVSTVSISGLGYLEGQTVSILGDGAVMPAQVVTGGTITLPFACSKVQVGLPITADIITTPVIIQGDSAFGQSRVKNINKGYIRVYNTGLFSSGPSASMLTPIKPRHFEPPGTPPGLITDEISLNILSNYNQSGQLMIRQDNPLPITVVYVATEVAIGG